MWQKLGDGQAVKDMALPDALAFARTDEASFNPCGGEKVGIGSDLIEALWKIALNQCFTGNIACRHRALRWINDYVATRIFSIRFAAEPKILDRVMDDFALEGVHRLEFDGISSSGRFFSLLFGKS